MSQSRKCVFGRVELEPSVRDSALCKAIAVILGATNPQNAVANGSDPSELHIAALSSSQWVDEGKAHCPGVGWRAPRVVQLPSPETDVVSCCRDA